MVTNILYIEDETAIRENVADILRLQGYAVTTAPNGREGISQALLQPPDLILCDIMMPELDGYQVIEAIRSNRSLANVPFIFLTAKTEPLDQRRGMVLGADDYLTKPFSINDMLQTIESRLQREARRAAALQARLNELHQSLTTVSYHEYNTPLSGILGIITLLMDNYGEFDQEDSLSMLAMIKVCSLRLKRSLDNVRLMEELQQVRPEDSAYAFFTNGISLLDNDVLNQQIHQVNDRHEEKIICQPDVDSTHLSLSETSLRIILAELIDNAHKFSSGLHPIQITGRPAGHNYRLTILNHGQLFKPMDIDRIAPYMQFDRAQFEQQGSGLGLAIVKKILDLNNGLLAIESLPTGETSVTVTLPRVNKA